MEQKTTSVHFSGNWCIGNKEVYVHDNTMIVKTSKEFVVIISDRILGPFPSSTEMISMLLELFNDPYNEKVIEKCGEIYRAHMRMRGKQ